MEIKKLGSIYFGSNAVAPGSDCWDDTVISLGNTVPGKELQWVDTGKMLVADRLACINISWDQLSDLGYIEGSYVEIDGSVYLCRSLKLGYKKGAPNEWDPLLDRFGAENKLWYWKVGYFWGQETVLRRSLSQEYRPVRGYLSARRWDYADRQTRLMHIGFRPVLEPVGSTLELSDGLVGTKIRVLGPGGRTVNGILAGYDGYDLVLDHADCDQKTDFSWLSKSEKKTFIDRTAVRLIMNGM